MFSIKQFGCLFDKRCLLGGVVLLPDVNFVKVLSIKQLNEDIAWMTYCKNLKVVFVNNINILLNSRSGCGCWVLLK